MRALRIVEHTALVLVGLAAGLGLDGGLRPWSGPLFVLLVVAAIVLGRFRPVRGGAWALLPGAVAVGAVAVVDGWEALSAVLVAGLTVALPWSLARSRGQQVALLATERARAEALLAERSAVAEGARLAERSRLAADIHHTLGHELALIGVRAGALELTGGTDAQRDAASAVRASAVAATDQLRRALDLLEPVRAAAPLDDVVERARRAGIEVELDGSTGGPLVEPLARLVEHVAREGIANAARHAAGAPVVVSCAPGPPELVLRLANGPGRPGEPGTGRGLAQLREQGRALGAEVHAGDDGGGWVLELRAPR